MTTTSRQVLWNCPDVGAFATVASATGRNKIGSTVYTTATERDDVILFHLPDCTAVATRATSSEQQCLPLARTERILASTQPLTSPPTNLTPNFRMRVVPSLGAGNNDRSVGLVVRLFPTTNKLAVLAAVLLPVRTSTLSVLRVVFALLRQQLRSSFLAVCRVDKALARSAMPRSAVRESPSGFFDKGLQGLRLAATKTSLVQWKLERFGAPCARRLHGALSVAEAA